MKLNHLPGDWNHVNWPNKHLNQKYTKEPITAHIEAIGKEKRNEELKKIRVHCFWVDY